MGSITKKLETRIKDGVKKYRPIIKKAQAADINETDTVDIIKGMLGEMFGYDQFEEVTSEYMVRGNYCDIALKVNGDVKVMIEAKAAGLTLNDRHTTQAINYCANSGTEWAILTNAVIWKIYRVVFSKPIHKELVYEIDMTSINPRKASDMEALYCLTKEGLMKGALESFYAQQKIANKYVLGQIILSDEIVHAIRVAMKRISSDIKVTESELKKVLADEVLKREILTDEADETNVRDAKKIAAKAVKKSKPAKPTAN